MRSSTGSTKVCWDNAIGESFFSSSKNGRVPRAIYATKAQTKRDIFGYIEGLYNNPLLPLCFEQSWLTEVHDSYQPAPQAA